jgi:DNA repair protein RecN (Recombination protein N)
LDKVASGGEVSRLALSLKRALADSDACGCFVLDEVDSGVSGAVAEEFGRLIQQMSVHCQVVCVTHLAQVAAFGDAHLRVEKEQRAGRTRSFLLPLSDQEARTRELARMLSGVQQTREALGAARALVRSARTGRRTSRPPRPNLALGRVVA